TFEKADNPAPAQSVRFSLDADLAGAVKRAAIRAVATLGGHEAEAFRTLAGFVRAGGADRDAAVRALRRIPRNAWPNDQVRPLIDAIVAYVAKLPANERTEPAALDALQLGSDLATLLPQKEAKLVKSRLGDLGVTVVLIRTVPHKMVYDRTKFYVEAGKPAVLVVENADIMPHNLLLCAPGSLTGAGRAGALMSTCPDPFPAQFAPKLPKGRPPPPFLHP